MFSILDSFHYLSLRHTQMRQVVLTKRRTPRQVGAPLLHKKWAQRSRRCPRVDLNMAKTSWAFWRWLFTFLKWKKSMLGASDIAFSNRPMSPAAWESLLWLPLWSLAHLLVESTTQPDCCKDLHASLTIIGALVASPYRGRFLPAELVYCLEHFQRPLVVVHYLAACVLDLFSNECTERVSRSYFSA